MSPKQNALYWRDWAAVRAAFPEADRHALHVQALGVDKSHKDFSNDDLSAVLSKFRSISQPLNLDVQLWHANEARRKLIWTIKRSPEAYWRKIALAKFGTADLDALNEERLTQLRNTLAARAGARRRKEKREMAGAVDDNRVETPF